MLFFFGFVGYDSVILPFNFLLRVAEVGSHLVDLSAKSLNILRLWLQLLLILHQREILLFRGLELFLYRSRGNLLILKLSNELLRLFFVTF